MQLTEARPPQAGGAGSRPLPGERRHGKKLTLVEEELRSAEALQRAGTQGSVTESEPGASLGSRSGSSQPEAEPGPHKSLPGLGRPSPQPRLDGQGSTASVRSGKGLGRTQGSLDTSQADLCEVMDDLWLGTATSRQAQPYSRQTQ